MSLIGTPTGYVLYNNALSDEISLTLERQCERGTQLALPDGRKMITANVIRRSRVCLRKRLRASPSCFELEKRQVKNPPASQTQSVVWSCSTPQLCSVPTYKTICIHRGPCLKSFSSQRPQTSYDKHTYFVLMTFCLQIKRICTVYLFYQGI